MFSSSTSSHARTRSLRVNWRIAGWVVVVSALGAAATGCTVRARTEPVGYTEVTYAEVPVDVYSYPSTVYEGRVVYLVGGNRWVYRDRDRWVQYRNEPPPLYRYRTTVQQAPPAPRYQGPPPREYPERRRY